MSRAEDVALATAEFQKAAEQLQAASAEKDTPDLAAPVAEQEAVLNKSRAYGTVGGDYLVGGVKVRYQQDGLNFDHLGKLVKE